MKLSNQRIAGIPIYAQELADARSTEFDSIVSSVPLVNGLSDDDMSLLCTVSLSTIRCRK